jgi:hypothetical protein
MRFYSTRDVATMLGLSPDSLNKALWNNKFDPPAKGPGRSYLWTEADIQRASWALRHQSADDAFPSENLVNRTLRQNGGNDAR